jgi:hypothetical protein
MQMTFTVQEIIEGIAASEKGRREKHNRECPLPEPEVVAAILFRRVLGAKRERVWDAFERIINDVPGRGFGAKLVNHAVSIASGDRADEYKAKYARSHMHIASAIEMLMRELEPTIAADAPLPSIDEVTVWINARGIEKLHFEYMRAKSSSTKSAPKAQNHDRKKKAKENIGHGI